VKTRSAILLLAAAAAAASGAALDYDRLQAKGLQLVVNGSFEQMHRGGKLPEGWGVVRDAADRLKVVTDPTRSKHGAAFVTFAPDRLHYLYGRLERVPSGKLLASVWARGKGEITLIISLLPANWRVREKPIILRQKSRTSAVDGEQWTECRHEFDLPETVEVDGKAERPEVARFQIAVRGKVSLDQCAAVPSAALPKAPAAAADGNHPTDLRPFVAIPRLTRPPTIDGKWSPDEWRGAAAVTGFTQLNLRTLAPRQTVVYVGFDAQKLYVAFRCPHEGKFGAGKPDRDKGWGSDAEGVEVWLQPPDDECVHFVGWPSGGILDSRGKAGFAWNGRWEFANSVEDSAETVGGVLLFARKLWTAELAIPFADLGGAPTKGATWRVNFCRDFSVPKGKQRTAADWTSWSPIQGRFNDAKQFGTARFLDDAPAVQMLALGDLANGGLSVEGSCSGRPASVRLSAKATLADTGKTVSFRSSEVKVPAAGQAPLKLSDTLKVLGATDLHYRVQAEEAATGRVLLRSIVPFTARASLRVKLIPLLPRRRLVAKVDASRVPDLPDPVHAAIEIFRGKTSMGISAAATWSRQSPQGELTLDIAKLTPGDYQVKAFVRQAAGGEVLASSVARLTVPERPAWLGNSLGVSDRVPPPWTPVDVAGSRVRITQREYRLAATGLPQQVAALGEDLFARPPRLRAVIDGKDVAWRARPLALMDKQDGRVHWRIDASAGPLRLAGSLRVEFDGFALWDVSVASPRPVTVDALALVFPFRADRALYARGRNAAEERGAYNACLYETKRPSPADICGSHFSHRGWVWPQAWFHELWIGDDFRGFSVMCETQEHLKGKRRTEIAAEPGTRTLTVHLVDGAFRLERPLRYRYAWQATPVKPRPANPKLWHATYRRLDKEPGYRQRVHTTLDYHALKLISYPALFRPRKAVDRRNATVREHGVKVVPYFCVQRSTTDAPELEPFLREWERRPVRTIGSIRGGSVLACVGSSFADYVVYAAKQIVDELGLDGLYLDVSSVHGCANHYHGCGYKAGGQWRPTANVFASREVYKRLYTLYKSDGRDAVLFRHGMPVAAVAGFVDVVTQGEDWCREGMHQYDRLTPDIFRAKSMRIQYGTPYTWYCFHHYYRGIKWGGRVPLDATLAYCLPHRVLPTEGRAGLWPVWDAVDPFWTDAEFFPYWSPRSPVATGDDDVLASIFWKARERKALLVVANWSRERREVDVSLDLAKLGLDPAATKVTRAVRHPIRQPEDPKPKDPMGNEPLALRGGKLHLRLAARNLEIVLLEAQPR